MTEKTQNLNTENLRWGDEVKIWIPDDATNKGITTIKSGDRIVQVTVEKPCWIEIN